jgi:2-keto-4-pentenoate hydratase
MEQEQIRQFADELFAAERERKQIEPLTERSDLTLDDAYYIQLANVKRVEGMGYKVSGKKIGITSLAMQKQLGIDEPDYGHLFDVMECKNGEINTDELIQPKIEAEVAFVLKESLTGGNVTPEDVRNATDYITAAFEIIDSRVADWRIALRDTVSDNASTGRYILGNRHEHLGCVDLAYEGMKLSKNGKQIDEGTGAAVLGDPCVAVAWLANRLWGYGVELRAGEVILSGAFTASPVAHKGDVFKAVYSTLGTIEGRFI